MAAARVTRPGAAPAPDGGGGTAPRTAATGSAAQRGTAAAGSAAQRGTAADGGASGCVFCGIVAGTEPGSVVHTEKDVVAFLTTAPVNPGHVLVVPRAHAVGLDDLPAGTGEALWRLAHRVAVALRRDPAWSEGVNLHLSDGAAAGQHVFHLHMHVIPRFSGDGLRIIDDRPGRPARAALDDVATRLREALDL